MNKLVLTARFAFWFAAFLLIGFLSIAFGLIAEAATWVADALCDLADVAVIRGRKLREQL